MRATPRERILAAARGEVLDRPPFSVWRHFYEVEGEGARPLAEALVAWVRDHDLDLLKYNPRAHYHAEPWGTRYRYPGGGEKPVLERYAVNAPADWGRIGRRRPTEPAFVELITGLRIARAALPEVPIVVTIFTPLAILERLAGAERVLADLRSHPASVLPALEAVTDTFAELARVCVAAGADGVFLATTAWAQRDVLRDDEYAEFGRPFDRRILEAVAHAPFNVLHVCGANARVLALADYPVAAVSWNTQAPATPSLRAFLATRPGRVAVGGLSDEAMTWHDASKVRAQIARGLKETRGRRWIVAGGCTIPTDANPDAIDAARDALETAWTR